MDDPILVKSVCARCRAVLDSGDNYCRRCGEPSSEAAIVAGARTASSPAQVAYWERPWVIVTFLFVLLGPFAIPMLWRSRRFTLVSKNILTALVLGETALLLWGLWFILQQAMGPLRELEKLFRS